MTERRESRISSAPVVSPSIVPSDMPDGFLPYGLAPPELLAMETRAPEIPVDVHRRIKAMAKNASKVGQLSPMEAAVCWHEAGRLLDWRCGRVGEAWICYNRALFVYPEHKPALIGLRRLARRAGAEDILDQLIEGQIDRASAPNDVAALCTESAIIKLRRGQPDQAMDALKKAVRTLPKALVPNLLKIGLAARDKNDEALEEALLAIAECWPESETVDDLHMILALLEEKIGRLDSALDRLSGQETRPAGKWARIRLLLRLNRTSEAVSAFDELLIHLDDPGMCKALNRLKTGIGVFAGDGKGSVAPDASEGSIYGWELRTLAAARDGDPTRAADAAGKLANTVQTKAFKEALISYEMIAGATPGKQVTERSDGLDTDSVIGRATASFLGTGPAKGPEVSVSSDLRQGLAGELCEAAVGDDAERLVNVLSRLREGTVEDKDRWALAAAESAVLVSQLGRPEEGLARLRGETDRLDRMPLPSLIRYCDSKPTLLAQLAIAEAEDKGDDSYRSWRLGWAAYHTESFDKDEAQRLYLRSLELMPTAYFSIVGLERIGADRELIAQVCLNAAEVTTDREDRFEYLIRAGIYCLTTKENARAAALFSDALSLKPDDSILRSFVLRMALNYPRSVSRDQVRFEQKKGEDLHVNDLVALGSICLKTDKNSAAKWFELALEELPGDPFVEWGLEEALLGAGRSAVLLGNLISSLKEAESPQDEAAIYQRLSEIDRRYKNDLSAAVLSLLSLDDKLPGHRPTLVRLVIHFLTNRQTKDLFRVLSGLAHTVTDDGLAAAFAAAAIAFRSETVSLDLLRLIVDRDPSALLEAAEIEALTESDSERIALLGRLVESLGESSIHLSRLADAVEESGDRRQAIATRERALGDHTEGGSLYDLFALARNLDDAGNFSELTDVLGRIKDRMTTVDYQLEILFKAAEIAGDELKDPFRAARLCLDILTIDPQNEKAYIMGRDILENDGSVATENKALLAELIEARLTGVRDAKNRRDLYLQLSVLLLESGRTDERAKARDAIESALDIDPEDIQNRRLLSDLYRQDQDWNRAIEHITKAARFISGPEDGIEVFFALGELYMNHTDQRELAEKSFLKVLGWDRSHFPALEHLSHLYLEMGNSGRASQALEHLIRLAPDNATKAGKMTVLARVIEKHFGREKEAERLLINARRTAPYAFGPIMALAEIYRKQGDKLALKIHIDGAMASQATLLAGNPDNIATYDHVSKISLLGEEWETLAPIAGEAMAVVGAEVDDEERRVSEVRWDVGTRAGDPTYDMYLCPKTLSSGLRNTMSVVEESAATLIGVSASQLNSSKDDLLNRNHPFSSIVGDMATVFGVGEVIVYRTSTQKLRVAPGSPSAIIVPLEVVQSTSPAVLRFAAARCLQTIRHGLSIFTMISPKQLGTLLAAIVRVTISDYIVPDVDEGRIASIAAKLRESLSEKQLRQIKPFAFDCADSIKEKELESHIMNVGNRVGFISAGSLSGAVKGLRAVTGHPSGALADLPGAGQLMSFVFSKDHLELRQKLGIAGVVQ